MDRLPVEVQLLYLEYLDAVDIIHLQQTCKHIFNLVEQFGEVIWRHCLRWKCERNGIFWASYSHLSKASDLKDACTTIPRFYHAYKITAAQTGDPDPVLKPIADLSFGPRKIIDFYTVPGGRFLLTFESTQLSMWDLHSIETTDKPSLVCELPKQPNESVGCIHLASPSKLHVLLVTHPSYLGGEEWSTSLELVQLAAEGHDRNLQPSMWRAGTVSLRFIPAGDEWKIIHPFANRHGKLAIHSTGDVSVIWDPIRSRCTGWRLDGVAEVMMMFCNDDFAIYLNPEGAHAVKIPELLPLEGGQIIFSSFEETRLTPTFSLQYPNSHSFTGGFGSGNIVFPAVYQPDRPLLFLVWEIVTDEMIHGYWYQFDVNRSNPQESTLKMVGSFRLPTLHLSAHNIHVYHGGYHPCGDRAAILWVHQSDDELDSLLFSFSSPTTIGPSPFSESSSGTRSESTSLSPSNDNTDSGPGPEVAATETSTLQLVHIMDGPVDRIEPRFCPTAGQLAILWTSGGAGELDSEEPHQRIQLYNFDS